MNPMRAPSARLPPNPEGSSLVSEATGGFVVAVAMPLQFAGSNVPVGLAGWLVRRAKLVPQRPIEFGEIFLFQRSPAVSQKFLVHFVLRSIELAGIAQRRRAQARVELPWRR